MKIYTRGGDSGETGLCGGGRTSKDAARIEVVGTLDELNALLGAVRAETPPEAIDRILERIQRELFIAGEETASPRTIVGKTHTIGPEHIAALESDIDALEPRLPPLTAFILPGGTRAAAALHFARTVCRRAERRLVGLSHCNGETVSPTLLAYVNRFSDLLFTLARTANHAAGREETRLG